MLAIPWMLVLGLFVPTTVPAPTPEIDVPVSDRPLTLDDFTGLVPSPDVADKITCVEAFQQRIPHDGQRITSPTTACLSHDSSHLYVVYLARMDDARAIRAHLVRRDQTENDDWVNVTIDSFNDRRRAYTFASNPLGIQWDAVWTEESGHDKSSDLLYETRGRIIDGGYIVVFTIPFSSLRTPGAGPQTWRLMLGRGIQAESEEAFWPQYSSRVAGRLDQAAVVHLANGPTHTSPLQVIPYASGTGWTGPAPSGAPAPWRSQSEAGADVKVIAGNNVVFDATVNPDFSQVESDLPQVEVNQRFEVFYPEKRPFFLENSGYFSSPLNLVFTRRILQPDLGGRMTGKLGNWATGGLMVVDRDRTDTPVRLIVGRANRDLGRQSTVGVLATERSASGRVNRVAAADGRLRLSPHWTATWQASGSATSTAGDATRAGGGLYGAVSRAGRNLSYMTAWTDLSPGFTADVGYLPRKDIRAWQQDVQWLARPRSSRLLEVGPILMTKFVWDHEGTRLDAVRTLSLHSRWAGQTHLMVDFIGSDITLRPRDVIGLAQTTDFASRQVAFVAETAPSPWFNLSTRVYRGSDLLLLPVAGQPPSVESARGASVTLGWRPGRALSTDTSYLLTSLLHAGEGVFTNQVLRTRWYWQISPRLAIRTVVRGDLTDVNALRTRLAGERAVTGDVLISYMANPWTAFYAGYTSTGRMHDEDGAGPAVEAWRRDSQQVFVKSSFLWRR